MCVLKVVYIRHEACLHLRARNLPCHVWLMSIGENSKPQLGGKHIGRLMEIGDGQLKLQGGT